MKLTIVGCGRAAWAFASIWTASGREVDAIITRGDPPPPFAEAFRIGRRPLEPDAFDEAELVLFAVTDRAIREVYVSARESIPRDAILFHASGSLSSELFDHEQRFSLHPLRSLDPPGTPAASFRDALVTWEGASATRAIAEELTGLSGGEFRAIATENKIVYHAAAVFGANYVAAVVDHAAALMKVAGIEETETALATLAVSAIRNWATSEGPARFTGPIARGELDVVRQHLAALDAHPSSARAYRALASILIDALGSEVDAPNSGAFRDLLRGESES